nr:MAG TPA: hypothetical protein [Caudoviricetes sp.]
MLDVLFHNVFLHKKSTLHPKTSERRTSISELTRFVPLSQSETVSRTTPTF